MGSTFFIRTNRPNQHHPIGIRIPNGEMWKGRTRDEKINKTEKRDGRSVCTDDSPSKFTKQYSILSCCWGKLDRVSRKLIKQDFIIGTQDISASQTNHTADTYR